MAKRVSNKKVLEWVSEQVEVAAGTASTRAVISLNLDDDEVAEIHAIETEIAIQTAELGADDEIDAQCMISMDPSVSTAADPYKETQYEDLETVHSHRENFVSNITTSGMAAIFTNRSKVMYFDAYPVLLATNPSFLCIGDAGIGIDYNARIWFTRRKAVGNELARTLLKRR